MKIDILGLAEVRWTTSGKLTTDDHVMVYSGHQKEHKNGVGVLLTKLVVKSMVEFHALSDRVLILKVASKPFSIVIIQVYASISSSADEDIEQFYNDLDSVHKQAGSQDMTIVMGDLNAKVGNEQDPLLAVVERHAFASHNERGDIWVDWCTTHDQVIINTWFQHHNRKCPGDGARN